MLMANTVKAAKHAAGRCSLLRVGLTGGLGSGKTTVAAMFAEYGAHCAGVRRDRTGADAAGAGGVRGDCGDVRRGGRGRVDGTLDRAELAQLAFGEGRVEELNAIVHPATIARQDELAAEIEARNAQAVVLVESALIFETDYGKWLAFAV